MKVSKCRIPGALADAAWRTLEAWDDWEPFPYLPEGEDGNPMTSWWEMKWTPDAGLHVIDVPLPEGLISLRMAVEAMLGFPVNAVTANRHLPPSDEGMPWHSDLVPELGAGTATVSLGAPRQFQVGIKRDSGVEVLSDWTLQHGDVVLWPRRGHQDLLHRVCPGSGARYAVNFRQYRSVTAGAVVEPERVL